MLGEIKVWILILSQSNQNPVLSSSKAWNPNQQLKKSLSTACFDQVVKGWVDVAHEGRQWKLSADFPWHPRNTGTEMWHPARMCKNIHSSSKSVWGNRIFQGSTQNNLGFQKNPVTVSVALHLPEETQNEGSGLWRASEIETRKILISSQIWQPSCAL